MSKRLGTLLTAIATSSLVLLSTSASFAEVRDHRNTPSFGGSGHDTANPRRVFISGQKRGVFGIIKRELRRRSAIEAVIGHMKTDGHLGRCFLKGREGDAINVMLTAVGHNLRLVLAWLRLLLRLILKALLPAFLPSHLLKSAC
jgi:transposase, IS5 family